MFSYFVHTGYTFPFPYQLADSVDVVDWLRAQQVIDGIAGKSKNFSPLILQWALLEGFSNPRVRALLNCSQTRCTVSLGGNSLESQSTVDIELAPDMFYSTFRHVEQLHIYANRYFCMQKTLCSIKPLPAEFVALLSSKDRPKWISRFTFTSLNERFYENLRRATRAYHPFSIYVHRNAVYVSEHELCQWVLDYHAPKTQVL